MKRFKEILFVLAVIFVLSRIYRYRILENFSFITKPHLTDGDTVYIRTLDDQYITVCSSCSPRDANINNKCSSVLCLKNVPYISSQFIYHKHTDGTFSLETSTGRYWKRCAECIHNCPHTVCADGINPNLQTHKFVLIKNGDDRDSISIKTDNGRLLEVSECDLMCGKIITALGLNTSNTFTIEKVISPVVAVPEKAPLKMVTFDKLLPHGFPAQWPFSQH